MELDVEKLKEEVREISNIEEIPSEKDDDFSNDDLYNISSYGADFSFREIITMWDEGSLQKPDLQRNYVWDKPEASRFIESILMGLPVPNLFFAKKSDNTFNIVDGLQRVLTVYSYVQKQPFPNTDKLFKLTNTKKINSKWRGKAFSELESNDQRALKTYFIHVIVFEQKKPKSDSSMYQIFERINTGGRTLLPQEIRNCIYKGGFNDLLKNDLNKLPEWRELFGLVAQDQRMRDVEYLLRFFALKDADVKGEVTGQISIKQLLNDYMDAHNKLEEKDAAGYIDVLKTKRAQFFDVISFLKRTGGHTVFRNLSTKDDKTFTEQFHPTIFDAITIATSIALNIKPDLSITSNEFYGRRIALLKDSEFKNYIYQRTTNREHIRGRIGKALKLLYGMDYA